MSDPETIPDVVAAAWAEALDLPRVDRDAGFFDLGADSAAVVRVVGVLRERWPFLRAVDAFLNPTVAELSAYIAGRQSAP